MTIHELASHKNFVPPSKGAAYVVAQRGITIYDAPMSPAQRADVKRRLAAVWPSIAACQILTTRGNFRLQPVRGAVIPDACTPEHVLAVVDSVRNRDGDMAVLQPDKVQS